VNEFDYPSGSHLTATAYFPAWTFGMTKEMSVSVAEVGVTSTSFPFPIFRRETFLVLAPQAWNYPEKETLPPAAAEIELTVDVVMIGELDASFAR
jgi:hypothetical protein